MQVAAVSTIIPLTSDKQAGQNERPGAESVAAATKPSAAKQEPAKPKQPYEPAPPIHPTVQDTIDINRSLRLLRSM